MAEVQHCQNVSELGAGGVGTDGDFLFIYTICQSINSVILIYPANFWECHRRRKASH